MEASGWRVAGSSQSGCSLGQRDRYVWGLPGAGQHPGHKASDFGQVLCRASVQKIRRLQELAWSSSLESRFVLIMEKFCSYRGLG